VQVPHCATVCHDDIERNGIISPGIEKYSNGMSFSGLSLSKPNNQEYINVYGVVLS
jgi:hypothetical protein